MEGEGVGFLWVEIGEGRCSDARGFAEELVDLGKGCLNALEAGVDGESEAITMSRLAPLAKVGMAMSHAGHGAEMLRHAGEGCAAVGDGFSEAFAEVVGDGTLVVRFCKIRIFVNCTCEFLNSAFVIPVVHVGIAALHEADSLAGATSKPDGPERVLSHLADHRIGIMKRNSEGNYGRAVADDREGECCDFADIAAFVGKEGDNLLAGPAPTNAEKGLFKVSLGEGGLKGTDEFLRVDGGGEGRRSRLSAHVEFPYRDHSRPMLVSSTLRSPKRTGHVWTLPHQPR